MRLNMATQATHENALVALSPYKETPKFFRTVEKFGGAQRWFDKAVVTVVSRDRDKVVLSMPKDYANQRHGIEALRTNEEALAAGTQSERPIPTLPDRVDVQVGPGGRIVIPGDFRDALEIGEGDRLMARVVDGELRLLTPEMAIRRAQKWVRETIPPGVSLVDDLLEMRRQEVEDELKDG
jgi:AbrB family looped-hinge helix DNA binding protein